MYLESLHLSQFRCFELSEFAFAGRATGIVGVNGSGKTALLEACSVVLGALVAQIVPITNPRPVGFDDERGGVEGPRQPIEIFSVLQIEGVRCALAIRHFENSSEMALSFELSEFLHVVRRHKALHPLLAHYRTGRLWFGEPGAPPDDSGWQRGYIGCLDPSVSERAWINWIKNGSEGLKRDHREQLASLLKHLSRFLGAGILEIGTAHELTYSVYGRRVPLRMVADGVRSILTIIIDLVWRASTLNPQLSLEEAIRIPGIILIDEIDLHLHPAWQRRAITLLRSTFPNVHLIVTTHSPFVIKELPKSALVNLDGRSVANDGSIEDISEEVLGVALPQRSLRQQSMIEAAREYFQALSSGTIDEAELLKLKRALDLALLPFADDVGVLSFLQLEEMAARSHKR